MDPVGVRVRAGRSKCVRGTDQKKGEAKKHKQIRALVRDLETFLLFLDYSKLEDCSFCAGGIFRKKIKD